MLSRQTQQSLHPARAVCATEAFGSRKVALSWMPNEPIPTFRQKTALDLVREGRTEAVVSYLESVLAGFVG